MSGAKHDEQETVLACQDVDGEYVMKRLVSSSVTFCFRRINQHQGINTQCLISNHKKCLTHISEFDQ